MNMWILAYFNMSGNMWLFLIRILSTYQSINLSQSVYVYEHNSSPVDYSTHRVANRLYFGYRPVWFSTFQVYGFKLLMWISVHVETRRFAIYQFININLSQFINCINTDSFDSRLTLSYCRFIAILTYQSHLEDGNWLQVAADLVLN